MQKDILLALILGFTLTGCVAMDEGNKEERQALRDINKAEKKMELGRKEQAAGAALTAKGTATYQEGKSEYDDARQQLSDLLGLGQ